MSGLNSKVCYALQHRARELTMAFEDSRRAVFHIANSLYSAKLVDLPCIVESQKTLDNKQMFKVADICQVASFPCLSYLLHLTLLPADACCPRQN